MQLLSSRSSFLEELHLRGSFDFGGSRGGGAPLHHQSNLMMMVKLQRKSHRCILDPPQAAAPHWGMALGLFPLQLVMSWVVLGSFLSMQAVFGGKMKC